mgnify:CR=1 FL=1
MNIQLNNNTIQIKNSISVEELIASQNISTKGIAVAVNTNIVAKSEWGNKQLKENDNIIIITATQGG